MKKNFRVLLMLLAIIPFFTNCSDKDEDEVRIGAATITFDNPTMTITDGELPGAITGSITAPSGAEIESILVTSVYVKDNQTNSAEIATEKKLTEVSGSKKGKYTFHFDQTTAGIKEYINELQSIKIVAVVKNGDTASKEMTFKHEITEPEPEVEYLSEAEDFEWKRIGGANATGLEQFGLAWTSNTATAAIIKTDNETKLVKLSAEDWSEIETKEQLKDAVDNGTDIEQYSGVSAIDASKTYDEVLAVDVKGEGVYYLIHITKSTVALELSGTTITITGESKN
ncbi:hypothetical protein [Parabacteroides sp. PF5-9]|uniref:hypothetical protein n=1 Tax=Parabacteroides sp. PF5-9 TaxID=1742404 RepID=UPI0024739925|nr:hypothetical protein [Parabacteroides sp. PF5-9]MDH6356827.1 hypothetical protein [Parabacteroides sp. PF5-9]